MPLTSLSLRSACVHGLLRRKNAPLPASLPVRASPHSGASLITYAASPLLEADPDERILDLLHKVKWFDDGSLAFRRSCAHGVCGSDAMVVNGENMLACQVLVKEVSTPIKIEPIRGLPVIKDLVVNMDSFFGH